MLATGAVDTAKNSTRTELGNGEDHNQNERNEVSREGLYPPREEYLNATRDQSLLCVKSGQ